MLSLEKGRFLFLGIFALVFGLSFFYLGEEVSAYSEEKSSYSFAVSTDSFSPSTSDLQNPLFPFVQENSDSLLLAKSKRGCWNQWNQSQRRVQTCCRLGLMRWPLCW
jgi:hypothetical protein